MRRFWKKCLKTAKNGPFFFYKNTANSSLRFKKLMLFTESHYSAKAPQNMRCKEQIELKKTLLFQIYHSLKFFWKMCPFYNFCQFFTIFGFISTSAQKLRCTKEIYYLDDSLAWKYIILGVYIANTLLKFWVKLFLKFFFDSRHHLHDNYRHPVKKNVTSEKMPLVVWISHQIIPSMPRWFDKKSAKSVHKIKSYVFFNGKFLVQFCHFEEFSLIFSMVKFFVFFSSELNSTQKLDRKMV